MRRDDESFQYDAAGYDVFILPLYRHERLLLIQGFRRNEIENSSSDEDVEARGTHDFEYGEPYSACPTVQRIFPFHRSVTDGVLKDEGGNEIEERSPKKKAKKAKKAKRGEHDFE